MSTLGGLTTLPRRLWWSSLPARVVITTLALSSLLLLGGGMLLTHQAMEGVLESKRQSAVAEAQTALDIAQASLRSMADTQTSVDLRLTAVALAATKRGQDSGQYLVIVQTGPATYQSTLDGDPIPAHLRDAITEPDKLYLTQTMVRFADARPLREVPGVVVGALLEAAPGTSSPIYFVFPLEHEVRTLEVLRGAVASVGLLLLGAMLLVAFFVARTVVSPVRRAALSARQIAEGHLDARVPVRGTDDLAVLGASMNDMAAKLEAQISSYQQLSRVQQRFVSDVSHELRTPLTTVRMASEVLYEARDDLGPVYERSAELLHDELDRFEALLGDLLEISRFDAGAAVLSLDEGDVADVVRMEVAAQEAFAQREGTPLRVTVSGDTRAEMDARRIQRVLRNLITNAIEHGEGRPVDITVAGRGDAVAVTVRDHGIGFEASQAEQVFHRFWRADPSRARTVGGTGLGLSIALEDALLHHGSLEAWGRPGRGAQFRLTLPRTPASRLPASPLPLAPAGEGAS